MVLDNHWYRWFSMVVHHWYDDGMVMYHRRSPRGKYVFTGSSIKRFSVLAAPEPSKSSANQSLSSKHTWERDGSQGSCSWLQTFERERWMAHKTPGLFLTAQRALKRKRYWLTRPLSLLLTAQRAFKRERYWLTRPLNLNLNLNQTTANYALQC